MSDTPSTTVRTRFAPAPTGDLHLGSARTALFNWLFARHHGGCYHLRIEDTDRSRSTDASLKSILEGLDWLGLDHDGDIVFQHTRADRHREVVQKLLDEGKAYYCFAQPQDQADTHVNAHEKVGEPLPSGAEDIRTTGLDTSAPVVRLKTPRVGATVVDDRVRGRVEVQNAQLDDMVLLRSDGSPTYMLAVVVDDHDMGITHVIRGDDHFTNTFRQLQLYGAMGWTPPQFAHIPLIHGADGAKLSKRHGATNVKAYADRGILPEAMCNYLLRLGWSHGDDEIISREQAIAWFTLDSIGKSPARFDGDKLLSLNAHYLRQQSSDALVAGIVPILKERLGRVPSPQEVTWLTKGMPGLQTRAQTLVDLADNAWFYVAPLPLEMDEKARGFLTADACGHLADYATYLSENKIAWSQEPLLEATRAFVADRGLKMRDFSQAVRSALTGRSVSPSVFEIMEVFGPRVVAERFASAAGSG